MQLSGRFESITQRIVIPPLKSALFALPFASLDQMLQAARSLYGRFATFRTTFLSLHAQLVLALPGNRQVRELILDPLSHLLPSCPL